MSAGQSSGERTMASGAASAGHTGDRGRDVVRRPSRRLSTETKASYKTTEFLAYLGVLAGLLIAGAVIDNEANGGGFDARRVWLYATILTVGYMVSRGLA